MNKASLVNGLWINDRKYNIRILAVLIAMEVLLAYSPFGYIVLTSISVTTLFIGVLIAALWGGPIWGGAVGLVFGVTSMWKASITAVNPNDLIFSPFQSGDPIGSILLAVGSRVLFGVVAGLTYYIVMKFIPRRSKALLPVLLISSLILERVHSSFVYLFMDKLFHVEGVSIAKSWENLFASNHIMTYIVTLIVITCTYLIYDRFLSKKYYDQFKQIANSDILLKHSLKYSILIAATLLVVALTASHLWERIRIVLFDIDKFPPETTSTNLLNHLILQFMIASISAIYIVIVLYRHARNVEELERIDAIVQLDLAKAKAKAMELRALKDHLTGVFNRKGMDRIISEDNLRQSPTGFVLIDIDHFKEINDNYGHDAGDKILTELAKALLDSFDEKRVFRLGGDEFAVLIENGQQFTAEGVQAEWILITDTFKRINKHLSSLISEDLPVTLSVGICFSENGYNDELYPLADSALYETKLRGRAGCTLVDQTCTVLNTWQDPSFQSEHVDLEISNTGIGRINLSLDDSVKPRLFCNESSRKLLSIPPDATPEKCYELWIAGMDSKYVSELQGVREDLMSNGVASFDYVWNHPLRGKVRVQSGGTANKDDNTISILYYYQFYFNENK